MDVDVATAGGSFDLSVPTSLAIDNTNNQPPCQYPSTTPCADAITIVSLGEDLSSTAVLGDTSFTLTILGFQNSSGQMVTQLASQEGSSNSVRLFARLEPNTRQVASAGTDHTAGATVGGINIDNAGPAIVFGGNAGTYTLDQTVVITCSATDGLSGIDTADCPEVNAPAASLGFGTHTLTATATDRAGNTTTESTTFEIVVTYEALCAWVQQSVDPAGLANSLCAQLRAAEAAAGRSQADTAANIVNAFKNEVAAQSGKAMTAQEAATPTQLADQL